MEQLVGFGEQAFASKFQTAFGECNISDLARFWQAIEAFKKEGVAGGKVQIVSWGFVATLLSSSGIVFKSCDRESKEFEIQFFFGGKIVTVKYYVTAVMPFDVREQILKVRSAVQHLATPKEHEASAVGPVVHTTIVQKRQQRIDRITANKRLLEDHPAPQALVLALGLISLTRKNFGTAITVKAFIEVLIGSGISHFTDEGRVRELMQATVELGLAGIYYNDDIYGSIQLLLPGVKYCKKELKLN